jgi:glycosyltransferase involved in cell wall biosynthesis
MVPPPALRRVAVLIPTHNNAGTIEAVVRGAAASGMPVLVVDDGSTDSTGSLAETAGATVLRHDVNQGKGAALLTGFHGAAERGFSHVIAMDADGQHLAADLPSFAAAIDREPDAIHCGTRPKDAANTPRSAKIGRAISDFMLWASNSHELGAARPDSQCGFRAYPLAHVLALTLRARRYSMEMEILVRASWLGVPLRVLPIDVYYPPADERVSHFHKWRDNARIVDTYTRLMLIRLVWPITRPRKKLLP